MRAVLATITAATLATSGCEFAVRRPAVTTGLVTGTIALGTCELASSEHLQCFGVSGAAGVGIGLITALAIWLGYEDADPATTNPDGTPAVDPTNLPPAPVFVPGEGSGSAAPPPAPPVEPPPAPPVDAGVAPDAP